MEKHNESIEEKLKRFSKLDPDTGCRIWIGAKGGRGRCGKMRISVKRWGSAHVIAWECAHGLRPEGFIIRHTCGNKLCINTQHMFLFKSSVKDSGNDIAWQLERLKRRIIVDPNTGCWEWQGNKVKGYGQLSVGKHKASAHRLMWECTYGETNGLQVLHKCDNRCCINPEHLWLGTNADNMQDKINKGRTARKLRIEAIRDIRISELSTKELAEKYGVNVTHIRAILRRERWKHIE